MDQEDDNNNDNNDNNEMINITQFDVICYAFVIGCIIGVFNEYGYNDLATILPVYVYRDEVINAATDLFETLRDNRALVDLAKKIVFMYLFVMLGTNVGGGGGNKSPKIDNKLMNDFNVAFNKLPQDNKNKLEQIKNKIKNAFCNLQSSTDSSSTIGGVRKQKTRKARKIKNRRKSRMKH
jgi:hypothetical protein